MARWANVGLMLGQRRRRCTNIKPILVQRAVPAGLERVNHYRAVLISLDNPAFMSLCATGHRLVFESGNPTQADIHAPINWFNIHYTSQRVHFLSRSNAVSGCLLYPPGKPAAQLQLCLNAGLTCTASAQHSSNVGQSQWAFVLVGMF